MVRYDQQDKVVIPDVPKEEERREHVTIDTEHMVKITEIFLASLLEFKLKDSNLPVIKAANHGSIIFDENISLAEISNTLGKQLKSKLEFVKEYYLYKLDDFIDIAYGRKVTAIQEFPYSFQPSGNGNIVNYEFIN